MYKSYPLVFIQLFMRNLFIKDIENQLQLYV